MAGVSASRTAVNGGHDQGLEALCWLISARQDGDVDQWHEESDKDHPGVRDYVHVLLPPTTKAALRRGSAAFWNHPVVGHEKNRVDEPGCVML